MRTPPDSIFKFDFRSCKRVSIPMRSLLKFVNSEDSLLEIVPTISLIHFAS
ncbi:hypothetical protein HanIR_Chr08g0344821 [Helianthus annuus]|nr:hypothetical protein HanIR_Chr08g0344821 [Helianthus annuus]